MLVYWDEESSILKNETGMGTQKGKPIKTVLRYNLLDS